MSTQDTDTFPAARPPAAFNPLTALDDLVSTVSAARAGDGRRHINRRPGSHPARRAPGEFLRRPVCVCERCALDVRSLGPAAPAPSDRQPNQIPAGAALSYTCCRPRQTDVSDTFMQARGTIGLSVRNGFDWPSLDESSLAGLRRAAGVVDQIIDERDKRADHHSGPAGGSPARRAAPRVLLWPLRKAAQRSQAPGEAPAPTMSPSGHLSRPFTTTHSSSPRPREPCIPSPAPPPTCFCWAAAKARPT